MARVSVETIDQARPHRFILGIILGATFNAPPRAYHHGSTVIAAVVG